MEYFKPEGGNELVTQNGLGVWKNITTSPTTIYMQPQDWKMEGKEFPVRDADGNTIALVRAQAFTGRFKSEIADSQGKTVALASQDIMSLRGGAHVTDPQGTELISMTGKWALKPHWIAEFTDSSTGERVKLDVHSDLVVGGVDIFRGDQCIAEIDHRQFAKEERSNNQQTFPMFIAAGVDITTIIAICVCADGLLKQKAGQPLG